MQNKFRAMLRKDRLMEQAGAMRCLQEGEYGVLATVGADGRPHGVPLSYVVRDGAIYFHCATKGEKLDNLRNEPRVCFTVVGPQRAVYNGDFTVAYTSVVADGRAAVVQDEEEAAAALTALTEKYFPDMGARIREVVEATLAHTCVVRIDIENVSGKQNNAAAKD